MLAEFRKFIMRGNVLDLAVAVIIGGAFGKIVSSLVNDILMPVVGMALGGVKFSHLQYVLRPATEEMAEVAIRYGQFIQVSVDFLIIAFAIFFIVRTANSLRKKEEAKPAAPPAPSKEVVLLTEIRDLLSK